MADSMQLFLVEKVKDPSLSGVLSILWNSYWYRFGQIIKQQRDGSWKAICWWWLWKSLFAQNKSTQEHIAQRLWYEFPLYSLFQIDS